MTFTLNGQGELAGLSVFYSDIISRYFNNDSARNLLIGSVFSFRVETTNYVNHEQQQTASVLSLTPSFSYCQLGDNYYWELRNYTQSAAFHIIQPFPYPFPFVDSYSYIRENETGDFAAWVVNMLAINSEGPVRCFYTFTCFLDLTGYLARNPTFQDVPDSCHYASLYKAGGEILGRKIGLARENPIDLEVWFLDNLGQELYDHVPRQLIASSNLLDEVGLPFQSKPELENFTALATAKSINFVEQTSVIEPEPVNINLNTITLDPDTDGGDIVPDSALDRRNEQYLKSLCDALAISDRPDGEIKTFEQPKHLESKADIPDGWSFYSGNKDGYGIYEKRSRRLIINDFGKPEFLKGGYVQCFNILQRLEAMQDDNTRMIGGDEASGFLIPTADGRYIHYESLFQVIADMAYNQSWITRSLNEIKINCMQLIHMGRDTLKAFGIPLKFKRLNIKLGEDTCQAAVPTLGGKTVTISSQLGLILMNLGLLVGGNLKVTKVDTDGVGQSKKNKA